MTETTPRIALLQKKDAPAEAHSVFDFWGEQEAWEKGAATHISMTLANHPELALAYYNFGKHVMVNSTLPLRPRELVTLRASWLLKGDYEWHYHVGYALNLGLSLEEIAAVGTGPDAGNWNEEDRAVLRATDEFIHGARLSDETWATLGKYFTQKQVMDLLFTIGNYVMLTGALNSFGVQLEKHADKIGYDLKTASGKTPAATLKPGEKGRN
jgi:4-carboxymuconolactone decarboxylase